MTNPSRNAPPHHPTTSQPRYVRAKRHTLHKILRIVLFVLTAISAYIFHFRDSQRTSDRHDRLTDMVEAKRTAMVPTKALLEKFSLTEEQCSKRFPGLIEEAGNIVVDSPMIEGGLKAVKGRIRKGELWVMSESGVS